MLTAAVPLACHRCSYVRSLGVLAERESEPPLLLSTSSIRRLLLLADDAWICDCGKPGNTLAGFIVT